MVVPFSFLKIDKVSIFLLIFTLLSSTIIFSNAGISTISTRTIALYPIADTYVDADYPTTNYGGEDHLYVSKYFSSLFERRAYLMFDLSSIDTEAIILSAELELWCWYRFTSLWHHNCTLGVHFCSDNSWKETTIFWDNQPLFSSEYTDVAHIFIGNALY